MIPRFFIASLLICLQPLAASHLFAQAPDARPNLIFLLTDDQRFDTLGCYGNKIIRTPHIDRLSKEGVTFDRAYVTTAICMTSRASIFTGQYALRHGVNDFRTNFTPEQLAATYPMLLKKAGYRVGFIGKWGVGQPVNDAFDYGKGFPGQGRYRVKQADGSIKHLDTIMGEQGIEFIEQSLKEKERNGGKPFCLSISFKAPHVQDEDKVDPYQYDAATAEYYKDDVIPAPPTADAKYFDSFPEFLRKSENRSRWDVRFSTAELYQKSMKDLYRSISSIDLAVGRIVARLRELKIEENTVIVFTGDHGVYLGDYGLAGKWYPHEVSIHVPLIVFDPRQPKEQRSKRRDDVVLNIDIAPTLLTMAGVEAPKEIQGRDMTPLIAGKDVKDWRQAFYYEHQFKHSRIPRSEGVRTPEWKYIVYPGSDPLFEELYDLKNDPNEVKNLAGEKAQQATVVRMRAMMVVLREQAK